MTSWKFKCSKVRTREGRGKVGVGLLGCYEGECIENEDKLDRNLMLPVECFTYGYYTVCHEGVWPVCCCPFSPLAISVQYILLGAEEGLFSLLVTNNPDPVMEQVSPAFGMLEVGQIGNSHLQNFDKFNWMIFTVKFYIDATGTWLLHWVPQKL